MKKLLFGIAIIALSFVSCERIIDIDLNEANPKIVIEANLSNRTRSCQVKITRTGSYFSAYTPNIVSGAKITLSNNKSSYSFFEETDGIYTMNTTSKLLPGTYKLLVEADGEKYEAVSVMPNPVLINYLGSEYAQKTYFQDAGYRINYGLVDPANDENYYRVKYFVNGELQNEGDDYFLISDELFNGNPVEMQLYGKRFEEGSRVVVELMSIDKNTYDYFNTLINVVEQELTESAAPANPKSNFSNGALGYFSAYSSDAKIIVVGEPNTWD